MKGDNRMPDAGRASNRRAHGVLTVTLSGSFNRFMREIQEKAAYFERHEVTVLSPRRAPVSGSKKGFVLLRGDTGSPREIEAHHLQAISNSHFLYLVNPGGYLGSSAVFEMGFAVSRNIPVFSSHPPSDPILRSFVHSGRTLSEIRAVLRAGYSRVPEAATTLDALQKSVGYMVQAKGFADETLEDKALLLTEELGELAWTVLEQCGVKVTKHRPTTHTLPEEVADCIIYLVDIANLKGINLETTLRKKLASDLKRRWVRAGQRSATTVRSRGRQ